MRYRLIVPIVVLASLVACARPPLESQLKEVKVGLLLPQTGSQAITGLKIRNGALLASEEINAAGGVESLQGAKLRLIDADSEGKPEIGMSETERLINREHVSVIIGCFQSSVAIPTTALSERYNTPYIVENPMADIITERKLRNIFRITAKSSWMARDQLRFLQEIGKKTGTQAKTVLLLYEDTDFGQSTAEGQRKYIHEAGLKIVGDLSYPHESPDFHATVLKMKTLSPDIVLATSYDADAALIRKTMAELGFFPKVAFIGSTGGYINPSFIQNVGPLSDNILTSSLWNYDLKKSGVLEFYQKYKRRFGQDPVPQSALTYASVYVLKDALERAGSADRDKLRDALATTDLKGAATRVLPYDRLRFDSSGQNSEALLIITQIQKGSYVTVWPENMAAGTAVWPARGTAVNDK